MNRSKPKNFGQRMKELKLKKLKEAESKELLERYPEVPSLESQIQQHLLIPADVTAPVEARTIIVSSQTPLERAVQTLREKAQGI